MLVIYGPDPREVSLSQIFDFLALRKAYFVDGLKWDLPSSGGREWDQYDLPDALFAIAYEDGKCVGGARIIPTSTEETSFFSIPRSWMIADFVQSSNGISESDLSIRLPHDEQTWEMTRFVATSPRITRELLASINQFLAARGAKTVLTLSPKPMAKVLARMGYEAAVVSKDLIFDGRPFVIIQTKVNSTQVVRQ